MVTSIVINSQDSYKKLNTYTRKNLVNEAVTWLVDWNYKAYRQEVSDPHPDDFLSESAIDFTYRSLAHHGMYGCALPYAIREKANAHDALENIISNWRHGRDGDTTEVKQMVDYYVSLPDQGFNRLLNEVNRKAEKRLGIKTDAYWAKKMLEGRDHV